MQFLGINVLYMMMMIYIFLQMATLATYFGLGQQTHRYFGIPSWNYITHSGFAFSLFEH